MNPEAIFKRTALWSLPLFSSLSAVADRQSPGRLAAAAVCTEKGCSPEAKLLPPAKGSQWAQIRWAVTLKIRLSLGQLDICLVTLRATCFFREILGGRNSTSYLLLLLLNFWWVSSSSLMLVWSPRNLNTRGLLYLVSAMLDGLDGMDPKASVLSGADPCLDPC